MSVKSLNSKERAEHLEYTLGTGASSGMGEAVARRLGASRALILHGRNAQRLEAVRNGFSSPEEHLIWNQDLPILAKDESPSHGARIGKRSRHCNVLMDRR